MENENKKIRNPFPAIGKVIKYEYLHSSKRILPIYGILLALGLICGILINPQKLSSVNFDNIEMESTIELDRVISAAGVLSGIAFTILLITSVIVTIVVLENRFKKSMLGEEAYLNLSLPVTIGEHLWGRIISCILWSLICAAVIALSFVLCFLAIIIQQGGFEWVHKLFVELAEIISRENGRVVSVISIMLKCLLMFVSISLLFTNFTFLVDSFSQLFKKNKGVLEFCSAIILLVITAKICSYLPDVHSVYGAVLIILGISAAYFAGTYFIFAKNLNLE